MKTNHDFANPAAFGEYIREFGRMVQEIQAIEGGLSAERLIAGEVAWRDPRDVYHQIRDRLLERFQKRVGLAQQKSSSLCAALCGHSHLCRVDIG